MDLHSESVKVDDDHKIGLLLSQIDTFLLDCDGVIWSGSRAIDGAKEFYSLVTSKGKNVIFLTNNSTKSRASYVKKLASFGINTTQGRIVSASYIAASYIKNTLKLPEDKEVYLIGMDGIKEELDLAGVKSTGLEENDMLENITDLNHLTPNPAIGAVLVGLDLKMNYMKFAKAHLYLTANPNLPYLATNSDPTLPSTNYSFPGAGALVAMLNTSLKNRTPTILGKPTKVAYETLEKCFNLDPKRTCMIGDRITTDIKFGVDNGLVSVLVLSGASSIKDLESSNIKPTFYANSIADLVPRNV